MDANDKINELPTGIYVSVAKIFLIFLQVYKIGVFVAFPYFNFLYAKEHGFMNWLLLGQVVPTAQAVVWPYYAINANSKVRFTDVEKANLEHYYRSYDAFREARKIERSWPEFKLVQLTPEADAAYRSLYKLALHEAELVDSAVLAKIHPELPAHFRDEYILSIYLFDRAITNKSYSDQFESIAKFDKWAEWVNASKLKMPKRLQEN